MYLIPILNGKRNASGISVFSKDRMYNQFFVLPLTRIKNPGTLKDMINSSMKNGEAAVHDLFSLNHPNCYFKFSNISNVNFTFAAGLWKTAF